MKAYIVVFFLVLATSCITERKAVQYMHDHKKTSSAFCAAEYPVTELTTIVVRADTAAARKVQDSLKDYAEHWISVAKERNVSLEVVSDFVAELVKLAEEKDSTCSASIRAIQAKLAAVPKVDPSTIRSGVGQTVDYVVQPCKDSIIVKTVENTAKTARMYIELSDEKAAHIKTAWWKDFWIYVSIALAILFLIHYSINRKK